MCHQIIKSSKYLWTRSFSRLRRDIGLYLQSAKEAALGDEDNYRQLPRAFSTVAIRWLTMITSINTLCLLISTVCVSYCISPVSREGHFFVCVPLPNRPSCEWDCMISLEFIQIKFRPAILRIHHFSYSPIDSSRSGSPWFHLRKPWLESRLSLGSRHQPQRALWPYLWNPESFTMESAKLVREGCS